MAVSTLVQVQALFDASLQVAEPGRKEFVLNASQPAEIRTEVLRLLELESQFDTYMDRPALELFPDLLREIGNQIAEFRLVRELGRGAMGVVYLADDTMLGRQVALKILGSHLAGSVHAVERFRREAQAVAKLKHPGIVPVYRSGEDRGTHFIAMEYVEGMTLDQQLGTLRSASGDGTRPPRPEARQKDKSSADGFHLRRCASIACTVANALEHAHRIGVLHRDVKPSNILLDASGGTHLTDFGIARLEESERLTRSGDVAGTFRYMSPEQVKGAFLDRRTDVFSLGIVLYEMLTLESPFRGDNVAAITDAIRTSDPARVRSINPAVPRDLETICHKALEKSPQHRYPTAAHLAADLDCFIRHEPIMARPPSVVRKAGRWLGKRKSHGLAVGILLLFCSLGVAGGVHLQNQWQTMTSITIESSVKGASARAWVRRWNDLLQGFEKPQSLGPLPILNRLLEPGPCRFLVTEGPGRISEFDEVLVAGAQLKKVIAVPGPDANMADEMVLFPAGFYTIHVIDEKGNEEDRGVYLESFFLDRWKVSNDEYATFVQETGYPPPKHWERYGFDESLGDRPVVGVSLADAQAYALWRGKRLPTAAEWEGAARWPDGRLYPWGDAADTPKAALPAYEALVAIQDTRPESLYGNYVSRTYSVSEDHVPASANGLMQMLGNVLELTSTVRPNDPNQVVLKGAYWATHPQYWNLSYLVTYPRSESGLSLGFRCARSQSTDPAAVE